MYHVLYFIIVCIIAIIIPRHYYYIWHWCTDIYSVRNIQCKLRHAFRQCDANPNKRCATMPNDFRNCCHYRFNHSIYDHASFNNSNATETTQIHCYYVTIQRRYDTDIIFRLDDIIYNHRRNEQCVETRRKREPVQRANTKKRHKRSMDSM